MKNTLLGLASIALATHGHSAVLAYEGFGNATDFGAIDGYTPSGAASSGLTGSYTQHQGGTQTFLLHRSGAFVGINGGHAPNLDGTNQEWAEHNGWDLNRASIGLSSSVDLSVDGTYYMSFFSRAGGNDVVTQIGLTDGTDELMWGRGWNRGITAYHGAAGTTADTNQNGTQFDPSGWSTLFYVARLDKTNSATTDDLTVSIMIYNLTTNNTIDSNDPASWVRTVGLTGIDNTFDELQFKLDGSGTWPSVDEIRLGNTWADVTGVPEPRFALLGGLGLLGLLRRRRA